jgi:hypothetical protein
MDLVQSGLTKQIGAPEDFVKNQEKNNFPANTDLHIPTDRESIVEDLEGISLGGHSEPPQDHRTSVHDQQNIYLPIGALNTFSQDWRIKARLLKKSQRTYKNDRGEGHILSLDLID